MRVLLGTIKKMDLAMERGRNVMNFAREAIDSSQTVQAFRRVVGEAASRAFMVSVFRAPVSLLIKDYSADPLSDEEMVGAALSPAVNYQASFDRELELLEIVGDGTLRDLVHGEMTEIENQLDEWGHDIFDAMGAVVFPKAAFVTDLDFMRKDVWTSVEQFLWSRGLETPEPGHVPMTPYRAALDRVAEKRGIEDSIKQILAMRQYAFTIYSAFLAHREPLIVAARDMFDGKPCEPKE